MSNRTLFLILVILNILDVLFTSLALDIGGTEANPYVNFFIGHLGYAGMFVLKVPPVVVFGFILSKFWDQLSEKWQEGTRKALIFLNLVLFAIVVYSFYSLLTLSQTFSVFN